MMTSRLFVAAVACAALGGASVQTAYAAPPASTLPAPAVVRIPTTYGGTSAPQAHFINAMDYGNPYHSREEIAAHQAQIQAQRQAAHAAYTQRFGAGHALKLKTIPERDR